VRRGKKRYVKKRDWALWVLGRQAIIEAQSEMLEALEGQVTMTKQQAMERTGLRETHITRYIKAGVFRSWPIPYFQADGKYWLVEAASVEAYLQARSEGRLAEYLDAHPAYVAVRKQMTKEVRTLRRQGRLGKRDPLTEPKSRYHPGCFTVAQVASHVGLSAQVVYKAIQNDQLKAHMVIRGRPRYGIELSEARRYAAWVKNRDVAAKRWHDNRRKAIAEAGLLTVRELAARWGYTEAKVGAWCRRGYKGQRLASRRWGRYLVFEPEDVEEFERKCGLDNKG
jgi:DNA-binding phage protein